jgi:hypothetical protein
MTLEERYPNPMAIVTLFTPTRNKSEHLREAFSSLKQQTDSRWEWLIVLNEPDARTIAVARELSRFENVKYIHHKNCPQGEYGSLEGAYPPAVMINTYYPQIQTKYLMFLADDDLLEPDAIETLVGALEANPEWDVVYGKCEKWTECESVFHKNDRCIEHGSRWWEPTGWIGGGLDIGHGTGISPDCVLDGGQILQTKRSYSQMLQDDWQLPTGLSVCGHVDGIYMQRLAEFYRFHFIDKKILTHRITALSTMTKPPWGWLA